MRNNLRFVAEYTSLQVSRISLSTDRCNTCTVQSTSFNHVCTVNVGHKTTAKDSIIAEISRTVYGVVLQLAH